MERINDIIPKKKNNLFFIPHTNCIVDKLDLINYTSDNTLSFLNYFIKTPRIQNFKVFLLTYDCSPLKMKQYREYLQKQDISCDVVFVDGGYEHNLKFENLKKILKVYYLYSRSKYIFTSSPYILRIPFKSIKQKQVSLNYFTPFKNDFFVEDQEQLKNPRIDYCITTSKIAAQVTSISERLSFEKFHYLGFSRNDNLVNCRFSKKQVYEFLSKKIDPNCSFERIILYTPTHRDYEIGENSIDRDVFGYSNLKDELNEILEKNNGLLVVKLHPAQNRKCIIEQLPQRSFIYEPNSDYSLYDIMPYSDVLLTDYTSAYFDYLILDKPVIFNFYDRDKYEKSRGFSYDPIENFCAGDIVTTKTELLDAIDGVFKGVDAYAHQRNVVNSIMNKYSDEFSSSRIYNFTMELINRG
jgi:CDP-glycerol glycerophosphotransferase (TagB/SpsB family)